MQQRVSSSAKPTIRRPLIEGWRVSAAEIAAFAEHVTLDLDRISELLPWLAPGPPNDAWRSYVSPEAADGRDLGRLFQELAITIAQFGGGIAFGPEGCPMALKHEGSFIKAILKILHAIQDDRKLPGIHISPEAVRKELAPYLIDLPFASARLAMMQELASPQSPTVLATVLNNARRRDGTFRFSCLHMIGLALCLPRSFGNDAPFYKKASLLLMTMEIALNQLGFNALAITPPPADYRIPHILSSSRFRILRYSKALAERIEAGHVFHAADPEPRAIRAMTVEAAGHIRAAYVQRFERSITPGELDGMLYLLSRNQALMPTKALHAHMMVATPAF